MNNLLLPVEFCFKKLTYEYKHALIIKEIRKASEKHNFNLALSWLSLEKYKMSRRNSIRSHLICFYQGGYTAHKLLYFTCLISAENNAVKKFVSLVILS